VSIVVSPNSPVNVACCVVVPLLRCTCVAIRYTFGACSGESMVVIMPCPINFSEPLARAI